MMDAVRETCLMFLEATSYGAGVHGDDDYRKQTSGSHVVRMVDVLSCTGWPKGGLTN